MVCYGCLAFFLLLGGLPDAMAGYYPLDIDHTKTRNREPIKLYFNLYVIKENKNRKQCETYQKEYKRNYIRKQTKMEIDKSGAPGKA